MSLRPMSFWDHAILTTKPDSREAKNSDNSSSRFFRAERRGILQFSERRSFWGLSLLLTPTYADKFLAPLILQKGDVVRRPYNH